MLGLHEQKADTLILRSLPTNNCFGAEVNGAILDFDISRWKEWRTPEELKS